MKQSVFLGLLLFFIGFSAAQAQEEKVLTGPLSIADLLDLPGWFGEEFLTYAPQPMYLDRIPEHLPDVEILCFLGTWCSDSKRDVPRMIRILQAKNIPPEKLRLIGLDRAKRSPGALEAQYAIERVPTFIFLRDGQELGRIVEAPLASLEKDMLGIIDPSAGKGSGEAAPPAVESDGSVAPDGSGADGSGADGTAPDDETRRLLEEKKRFEQEREAMEKDRPRSEETRQKK